MCIIINTGILSQTRIKHVSETDTSLVLFNALSVEIAMDHRECKESLIYIMSLQHNQSFSVFGSAFGDDRETSLFVRQTVSHS